MFTAILLIVVGAVSAKHDPHTTQTPPEFADWLKHLEAGSHFEHLSLDEKLMFSELVMAAEEGPTQLTDFIHRKGGLASVLTLADELLSYDRTYFEDYLSNHLANHPHQHTKRSDGLFSAMYDLHIISKMTKHFPYELEHLFVSMMRAAEHDSLTQFIETTGYAPILHMFSEIGGSEGEELNNLVLKQLEKEKAMQASS